MDTIIANIIIAVISPFTYFVDGSQRVFLPYLIIAYIPVAIAAYLYYGRNWSWQKIADFCFPDEIWHHPSSKLDRKFFITNTILFKGLFLGTFAAYVGVNTMVSMQVESLFVQLFGPANKLETANFPAIILITFILLLFSDFAIFLAHWLQHKIPFLWEFHKIHHSARVMTPITVYRMHPIDDLLAFAMGGILTGIPTGLIGYIYLEDPGSLEIFGLNIFTFIFYVAFYNLRHTHFWLHYGKLSYIFVSPAMHQCHHSQAKKHWDKNMGFIFSFWDKLFGTLYLPTQREELVFGIGDESEEYNSLTNLYVMPFVKNWNNITNIFRKRNHDEESNISSNNNSKNISDNSSDNHCCDNSTASTHEK